MGSNPSRGIQPIFFGRVRRKGKTIKDAHILILLLLLLLLLLLIIIIIFFLYYVVVNRLYFRINPLRAQLCFFQQYFGEHVLKLVRHFVLAVTLRSNRYLEH